MIPEQNEAGSLPKAYAAEAGATVTPLGTDYGWDTNPDPPYRLSSHPQLPSYLESSIRRAFTWIEPVCLQRVEAYISTVPGRYGLKALRFRGDRRMGMVLLGDWHEGRAKPGLQQTMDFEGGSNTTGLTGFLIWFLQERRVNALQSLR